MMNFSDSLNNNSNCDIYINDNTDAIDNRYILFEQKMFLEAKSLFKQSIQINPLDKKNIMYYIVCVFSSQKIDTLTKINVDDLYKKIDLIKDGEYSNISNYLWCILYREYNELRAPSKGYEKIFKEKRNLISKNRISNNEKKLLLNIILQTRIKTELLL